METGHTVGSFTREPPRLPAMARERDGLARGQLERTVPAPAAIARPASVVRQRAA